MYTPALPPWVHQVYGSETNQSENSEEHKALNRMVADVTTLAALPASLVDEVGGRAAWETFARSLKGR